MLSLYVCKRKLIERNDSYGDVFVFFPPCFPLSQHTFLNQIFLPCSFNQCVYLFYVIKFISKPPVTISGDLGSKASQSEAFQCFLAVGMAKQGLTGTRGYLTRKQNLKQCNGLGLSMPNTTSPQLQESINPHFFLLMQFPFVSLATE